MSETDQKNLEAVLNPKPGDYWHEMFVPYFIVVNVKDDKYTVLSCMGGPDSYKRQHEPNAKILVDDDKWCFDYSKSMIVDGKWIEQAVKYQGVEGFAADVVNSVKTQSIVNEWRDFYQKKIRNKIESLESEWEEFTGWRYLKEENLA